MVLNNFIIVNNQKQNTNMKENSKIAVHTFLQLLAVFSYIHLETVLKMKH